MDSPPDEELERRSRVVYRLIYKNPQKKSALAKLYAKYLPVLFQKETVSEALNEQHARSYHPETAIFIESGSTIFNIFGSRLTG